jgi:hypothetical protein
MLIATRTFRVFVSSAFEESKEERDAPSSTCFRGCERDGSSMARDFRRSI